MELKFRKRFLDDVKYEAAAVFDVNNDGVPDIVSGEYWYEGPEFTKKHKICDVVFDGNYHHDFCDYGMDVNGDGKIDIITGSWFGEGVMWRENPGDDREWATRLIEPCSNIETIRFLDVDNCGMPEIFPNTPNEPQFFLKLIMDETGKGTGSFRKHVISEGNSGHGMGFGDINGDGRVDVILKDGWLEQPANPFQTPWTFHREFDLGSASVPVLAHDITGNGLMDLICGQAHDYGLAWWEQGKDAHGNRTWVKHEIDTVASQYHDLWLADLDGDGEMELITGKRYMAHNGRDPGEYEPIGIYWYKIDGGKFEKHVIDYGPAGQASGCGIYFWVADLNGDGRPDIVAPGKDGLYLFENLGIC